MVDKRKQKQNAILSVFTFFLALSVVKCLTFFFCSSYSTQIESKMHRFIQVKGKFIVVNWLCGEKLKRKMYVFEIENFSLRFDWRENCKMKNGEKNMKRKCMASRLQYMCFVSENVFSGVFKMQSYRFIDTKYYGTRNELLVYFLQCNWKQKIRRFFEIKPSSKSIYQIKTKESSIK